MSTFILDGKALAALIHNSLRTEIEGLKPKLGRSAGLAVILVGENPASQVYVASKEKLARSVGMETFNFHLSPNASDQQLKDCIVECNKNKAVDGILLQLPLPAHLNEREALALISPLKDVDGLHTASLGELIQGKEGYRPCTPSGALRLIDLALFGKMPDSYQDLPCFDLAGKKAIVIGRSILVGKPLALMLLERNATVTMAHSKTPDLAALAKAADIVVAAVGKPNLIGVDHLQSESIVIDVGINRLSDKKITGDVDFEAVKDKVGAITPVPGGVGPLTIAMLLANTVKAWKLGCGAK